MGTYENLKEVTKESKEVFAGLHWGIAQMDRAQHYGCWLAQVRVLLLQ